MEDQTKSTDGTQPSDAVKTFKTFGCPNCRRLFNAYDDVEIIVCTHCGHKIDFSVAPKYVMIPRTCKVCEKSCQGCEFNETPRWCFCCPECSTPTVEDYDPEKHGKITFMVTGNDEEQPKARSLSVISREIFKDWKNMCVYAKPYALAMQELNTISDKYGFENGGSIVRYFLSNAGTWRGETARRIKAELKSMLPY